MLNNSHLSSCRFAFAGALFALETCFAFAGALFALVGCFMADVILFLALAALRTFLFLVTAFFSFSSLVT